MRTIAAEEAKANSGDLSVLPTDCSGTDYSNTTEYGCTIAEKTGDDFGCGDCKASAPMKSIGVVAIIALIATLL